MATSCPFLDKYSAVAHPQYPSPPNTQILIDLELLSLTGHGQPHYRYAADNPQQIEKMRIFKLGLQENFTMCRFEVFHICQMGVRNRTPSSRLTRAISGCVYFGRPSGTVVPQ